MILRLSKLCKFHNDVVVIAVMEIAIKATLPFRSTIWEYSIDSGACGLIISITIIVRRNTHCV